MGDLQLGWLLSRVGLAYSSSAFALAFLPIQTRLAPSRDSRGYSRHRLEALVALGRFSWIEGWLRLWRFRLVANELQASNGRLQCTCPLSTLTSLSSPSPPPRPSWRACCGDNTRSPETAIQPDAFLTEWDNRLVCQPCGAYAPDSRRLDRMVAFCIPWNSGVRT